MPASLAAYYQESGRAGRDGKPSRCRIYYSRQDMNILHFLLKQDQNKRKAKKKPDNFRTVMEDFESMVELCEKPFCRHACLARYFGDQMEKCEKQCDYCVDSKAVNRLVAALESRCLLDRIGKKRNADPDSDTELYDGGKVKWGVKSKDDEGEVRGFKKLTDESSGLGQFISEEFKRRKKTAPPSYVDVKNLGATILEPDKRTSANLTIMRREQMVKALRTEIEQNYQSCLDPGEEAALVAAEIELDVVRKSKTGASYTHNIHKKVSEIRKATQNRMRFISDCPKYCGNLPSTSKQAEPLEVKVGNRNEKGRKATEKKKVAFISPIKEDTKAGNTAKVNTLHSYFGVKSGAKKPEEATSDEIMFLEEKRTEEVPSCATIINPLKRKVKVDPPVKINHTTENIEKIFQIGSRSKTEESSAFLDSSELQRDWKKAKVGTERPSLVTYPPKKSMALEFGETSLRKAKLMKTKVDLPKVERASGRRDYSRPEVSNEEIAQSSSSVVTQRKKIKVDPPEKDGTQRKRIFSATQKFDDKVLETKVVKRVVKLDPKQPNYSRPEVSNEEVAQSSSTVVTERKKTKVKVDPPEKDGTQRKRSSSATQKTDDKVLETKVVKRVVKLDPKQPNGNHQRNGMSKESVRTVVVEFLSPFYRKKQIADKEAFKSLARDITHWIIRLNQNEEKIVRLKVEWLISHIFTACSIVSGRESYEQFLS